MLNLTGTICFQLLWLRDYDEIQLIIIASNFTGYHGRPHAVTYGKKWSKLMGEGGFLLHFSSLWKKCWNGLICLIKSFCVERWSYKIITLDCWGTEFKKKTYCFHKTRIINMLKVTGTICFQLLWLKSMMK